MNRGKISKRVEGGGRDELDDMFFGSVLTDANLKDKSSGGQKGRGGRKIQKGKLENLFLSITDPKRKDHYKKQTEKGLLPPGVLQMGSMAEMVKQLSDNDGDKREQTPFRDIVNRVKMLLRNIEQNRKEEGRVTNLIQKWEEEGVSPKKVWEKLFAVYNNAAMVGEAGYGYGTFVDTPKKYKGKEDLWQRQCMQNKDLVSTCKLIWGDRKGKENFFSLKVSDKKDVKVPTLCFLVSLLASERSLQRREDMSYRMKKGLLRKLMSSEDPNKMVQELEEYFGEGGKGPHIRIEEKGKTREVPMADAFTFCKGRLSSSAESAREVFGEISGAEEKMEELKGVMTFLRNAGNNFQVNLPSEQRKKEVEVEVRRRCQEIADRIEAGMKGKSTFDFLTSLLKVFDDLEHIKQLVQADSTAENQIKTVIGQINTVYKFFVNQCRETVENMVKNGQDVTTLMPLNVSSIGKKSSVLMYNNKERNMGYYISGLGNQKLWEAWERELREVQEGAGEIPNDELKTRVQNIFMEGLETVYQMRSEAEDMIAQYRVLNAIGTNPMKKDTSLVYPLFRKQGAHVDIKDVETEEKRRKWERFKEKLAGSVLIQTKDQELRVVREGDRVKVSYVHGVRGIRQGSSVGKAGMEGTALGDMVKVYVSEWGNLMKEELEKLKEVEESKKGEVKETMNSFLPKRVQENEVVPEVKKLLSAVERGEYYKVFPEKSKEQNELPPGTFVFGNSGAVTLRYSPTYQRFQVENTFGDTGFQKGERISKEQIEGGKRWKALKQKMGQELKAWKNELNQLALLYERKKQEGAKDDTLNQILDEVNQRMPGADITSDTVKNVSMKALVDTFINSYEKSYGLGAVIPDVEGEKKQIKQVKTYGRGPKKRG